MKQQIHLHATRTCSGNSRSRQAASLVPEYWTTRKIIINY